MVGMKKSPWKVNPKCLSCGGKGCLEVEVFDSSRIDFTWIQCHTCERWWERRLVRIIELGEPLLIAEEEAKRIKDEIIPSKNEGLSRQERDYALRSELEEESLAQYRKAVQSGMYLLDTIRLDNGRTADPTMRAETI